MAAGWRRGHLPAWSLAEHKPAFTCMPTIPAQAPASAPWWNPSTLFPLIFPGTGWDEVGGSPLEEEVHGERLRAASGEAAKHFSSGTN